MGSGLLQLRNILFLSPLRGARGGWHHVRDPRSGPPPFARRFSGRSFRRRPDPSIPKQTTHTNLR
jgi:hypothetical protein